MSAFKRKLYFRVAILALLISLASGGCVYLDLGMERGSIPDSKITASSVQSVKTPAKNGRLNFASGSSWCAATSDNNPYLQIDLQTLHIICAVSTQGNSQADQWVTNYTLQSSTNGSTWTDYKEIGQVKTFKGNSDRNSEVKHILYEGIAARYFRFLPQTHHRGVCLRTEVFGVKTPDKPVIKELPKRTILAVGELAILTCEVSGDPEPSVTWTKDGETNIPRAAMKNNGHILAIKDVSPVDSGVYECKATNRLGESRSSATVIIAVSPFIIEDTSPRSVVCEKQTLCLLSCYATSDVPFNYSWTKNGVNVLANNNIKVIKNSIAVTPRGAKDYGVYACHATNSFGSTAYKITLAEGLRSSLCEEMIKGEKNVNSIAAAIILSCIVVALLAANSVLIWRLRRPVSNTKSAEADRAVTHNTDQPDSPRDQNVPEPGPYMELRPSPLEEQTRASLQGDNKNSGYYNVGFIKGNNNEEQDEIYDQIGDASD